MVQVKSDAKHVFETAGLGLAPFHVVGVCDKVGPINVRDPASGIMYQCGSPGQPMGTCKFCGTGIKECWSIKSADGKVFDVGCECVSKTGDAGMKRVIDAHKCKVASEKRRSKGMKDCEFVDNTLADPASTARLASLPHPNDKPYFAEMTSLDFVVYMRKNSGDSGMGRLASWIKKTLA